MVSLCANMYIQYNWPNVRLDKRKSSSFSTSNLWKPWLSFTICFIKRRFAISHLRNRPSSKEGGKLNFFSIFQKSISIYPLVANYGDALWWAFMDVTTVGSNISAITVTGRVLSVVLAALGMMMFPIFTVYVTSLVQKSNEEKKRFYENIQAPSPQPEVKDK